MFERLRRGRLDGELSDEELHRAALAGSGEAMAALYRRHGGLVYRFTLQMSRNAAVAEEITQEVFLALLTQIDRFDAGRGALSTWLCGIARRQLWKIWSETKRRRCSISMKRAQRNCDARAMGRRSYCCGVKPLPRCGPEWMNCRRLCAK